jgi:hypothetical protein
MGIHISSIFGAWIGGRDQRIRVGLPVVSAHDNAVSCTSCCVRGHDIQNDVLSGVTATVPTSSAPTVARAGSRPEGSPGD